MDNNYNLYELMSAIAENNEDEFEAIKNYSLLLDALNNVTTDVNRQKKEIIENAILKVNEYISEEMKHSNGLTKIYSELSGIIAED